MVADLLVLEELPSTILLFLTDFLVAFLAVFSHLEGAEDGCFVFVGLVERDGEMAG